MHQGVMDTAADMEVSTKILTTRLRTSDKGRSSTSVNLSFHESVLLPNFT